MMIRLTSLVDNTVGGGRGLWGEHGLSFLVETASGAVLWDTGQSGAVLAHNLTLLAPTLCGLGAVGLSHAHYDHTGGLAWLLEAFPGTPVYAHTDLFRERYAKRESTITQIGISAQGERLPRVTRFHLADGPQALLPGVHTTGSIDPRPYPQGASPHLLVRGADGFVPDPYADDMSLVLEGKAGLVVLCGCCHAGLRNTLEMIRRRERRPISAIVGGTHLQAADDAELSALTEWLRREGSPALYLSHCTGSKALYVLGQTFGDRLRACPVGTILEF